MAEEPIFDLLDDINRLTRTVSSRDRSHATVHSIDNGQMYGGWKPVDGASEPAWQLPVAVASDEPQRIHLRRGWFLSVLLASWC